MPSINPGVDDAGDIMILIDTFEGDEEDPTPVTLLYSLKMSPDQAMQFASQLIACAEVGQQIKINPASAIGECVGSA